MKILRNVFGPVKDNGVWRIHTNQKLMDLYRETDIISASRKARSQWLGHVERMPEERTVKEVFKNIPEGKGQLESQERDGWTMLKIISRK
jgi:hypothetical protein